MTDLTATRVGVLRWLLVILDQDASARFQNPSSLNGARVCRKWTAPTKRWQHRMHPQHCQESPRFSSEPCFKFIRTMLIQPECLLPLQTWAMSKTTKPFTWMVSNPTPHNAPLVWLGSTEKTFDRTSPQPTSFESHSPSTGGLQALQLRPYFFDMFCAFLYNVVRATHPLPLGLHRLYLPRSQVCQWEDSVRGLLRKSVWRTTVDTLSSHPC